MNRAISIMIVTVALCAVVGCGGIAGRWTLHETDQENFPISEVTLNEDGTYTAVAAYGDIKHESSGNYTFAGGELTFISEEGKARVYAAELQDMNRRLRVTAREGDGVKTATMKRSD